MIKKSFNMRDYIVFNRANFPIIALFTIYLLVLELGSLSLVNMISNGQLFTISHVVFILLTCLFFFLVLEIDEKLVFSIKKIVIFSVSILSFFLPILLFEKRIMIIPLFIIPCLLIQIYINSQAGYLMCWIGVLLSNIMYDSDIYLGILHIILTFIICFYAKNITNILNSLYLSVVLSLVIFTALMLFRFLGITDIFTSDILCLICSYIIFSIMEFLFYKFKDRIISEVSFL